MNDPPTPNRAVGDNGLALPVVRAWAARALRRFAGPLPPPAWTATVAAILALVLLPVVTIASLAIFPTENIWPHLMRTVLPDAIYETAVLVFGVGLLTLTVGTGTAWLVTMYRFPGRALLDRLLVIPLAMPGYIVAYCYVELLDYGGPVQTALRSTFGWRGVADYWFPNIRSLGGAIFVLSAVLYPYVYLTARASFVQQSVCVLEVARTLGRTSMGTFWAVALPLSRPALAAGVALALMEALADLGAVQYLGVQSLTATIYATWLQRSNLGGAAQLAALMLTVVLALFAAERFARGGARVHHTTGRYRSIPFQDLDGLKGWLAATACLLPFLVGFVAPVVVLIGSAVRHISEAAEPQFWRAVAASLMLASLAAVVAVLAALVLGYARRIAAHPLLAAGSRVAGIGYAIPGTVLAIGLMVPLAAADNWVDAAARAHLGISTGLLLSGSLFALVLAFVIRFLAIALGAVESGLERISPNLDAAGRTLGETQLGTLLRIHVPLLAPAMGAAALLVFVDGMKELPATLLMRPFNFDTLSTYVYTFASLEQFEQAALGALAIVLVGLAPVLLLHKAVADGRAGTGP